MNPKLLQHPNIPKPMHGLNPRSIMGKEQWDELRFKVQAEQSYRCAACGVQKTEAWPNRWLECHEDYTIDYYRGIMQINKFVCLCPACHKFIHSGRLQRVNDLSADIKTRIVQHGWDLLSSHNLYPSPATHELISSGLLPAPIGFISYRKAIDKGFSFGGEWERDEEVAQWADWRMILDGKEYKPLFNTFSEWRNHYN